MLTTECFTLTIIFYSEFGLTKPYRLCRIGHTGFPRHALTHGSTAGFGVARGGRVLIRQISVTACMRTQAVAIGRGVEGVEDHAFDFHVRMPELLDGLAYFFDRRRAKARCKEHSAAAVRQYGGIGYREDRRSID